MRFVCDSTSGIYRRCQRTRSAASFCLSTDGPKTPMPTRRLRGRLSHSHFMEWRATPTPPANTSLTTAFTVSIGKHLIRAEPFATSSRSQPLVPSEAIRRAKRRLLRLKVFLVFLLSMVTRCTLIFGQPRHANSCPPGQCRIRVTLISCSFPADEEGFVRQLLTTNTLQQTQRFLTTYVY